MKETQLQQVIQEFLVQFLTLALNHFVIFCMLLGNEVTAENILKELISKNKNGIRAFSEIGIRENLLLRTNYKNVCLL